MTVDRWCKYTKRKPQNKSKKELQNTRMHGMQTLLETMSTVYGKTENSTSSKYKMAKDIQTPPRIYDYVAELSCCAKSKQIGPPNFAGEIGEVSDFYSSSSFFSHIQSVNQSNKFFHFVYRSQIWKNLKYLRLKTRGFTPRCAFWGYRC